MRVPYMGASRNQYEDYYRQQQGGGIPYFVGSRIQHGRGLGSLFSSLFRNALPMLKRGLSIFGKHALRTGLDVATDVISKGDNIKDSVQRRISAYIPESIKRMGVDENHTIDQTGSGLHRRRKRKHSGIKGRKNNKKSKKNKKNKKKHSKLEDIF